MSQVSKAVVHKGHHRTVDLLRIGDVTVDLEPYYRLRPRRDFTVDGIAYDRRGGITGPMIELRDGSDDGSPARMRYDPPTDKEFAYYVETGWLPQ